MSRVTLINPNSKFILDATHVPPLGLLTVSSILKEEGVKINFIDLAEKPTTELEAVEDDRIGVTGTTPHYGEFSEIARRLTKRRLIAGGPHANVRPDSLRQLGYEIGGSRPSDIIKVFTGRTVADDINMKYFPPDRSLINRAAYNGPATVIVSTGCPYACGFCAKPEDEKYFRYGLEDVMDEIQHLFDSGERRLIFRDDLFTANKPWVYQLCDFLTTLDGLEWSCITRSDRLTGDLLERMAASGLAGLAIGVESGSQTILDIIDKKIKVEDNTMAREACRDLGIRFKAYIVYGLPGESQETLNETYTWLETNQPDAVGLYLFMPLPGSPIFDNRGRYDIQIPDIPFEKMYYAGDPSQIKCVVSTSSITANEITAFYHKTVMDFNLQKRERHLL